MSETKEAVHDTFLGELKSRFGPHGSFTRAEAQTLRHEWPEWEEYLERLLEYGRVGQFTPTTYRIA